MRSLLRHKLGEASDQKGCVSCGGGGVDDEAQRDALRECGERRGVRLGGRATRLSVAGERSSRRPRSPEGCL